MGYSRAFKDDVLTMLAQRIATIGLLTYMEDGQGGEGEVVAPEYTRVPISFSSPENSVIQNTSTATFPSALQVWGEVAAYGLYGHDNVLLYQVPLNPPVRLVASLTYEVRAGDIQIMVP